MPLTKVTGGVIADATITTDDIATGTIATGNILDGTIVSGDMALDPRNASNLNSGSVPAAQLDNVDTAGLQGDIAILAFKTQANGNLARYNLVDQSVDAFEDATGISASDSTNEVRDASGKYYSGAVAATGGTKTQVTISATVYDLFTFTEDGTLTSGAAANVDILVVGGGGSGGKNIGGGGGAGGLVYKPAQAITASSYGITIGGGGVYTAPSGPGNNGGDSVFDTAGVTNTLTGKGGGAGGGHAPPASGVVGGSGGADGGGSGSAAAANQTSQPGDSGTYGFGNAGAEGVGSPYAAGGGGGAGGAGVAGVNSPSQKGGDGGVGKDYSGTFGTGVGASGWFAGGGGGSVEPAAPVGAGGTGGGGAGSTYPGTGTDGTANTGGGGGGTTTTLGATGGSGVVIIRSAENALSAYNNMTLESITTTTATAPTKGDLVFTYSNAAGTAVVGTNITAEYSADAGSTWTDFGIAAGDVQGTTGGHTIVTKNNVSLTSTSGTNMRYRIKTLVQSASLATRIHAVSLGWS